MKRFTSISIILITLIFTSSLFASGVALTGIGARATALGGNYRALSNDWSAMYWNPAGLTAISGLHFGISSEIITPAAKYLFSQNSPAFGIFRDGEIGNESKSFFMPAAGIAFGMDDVVLGIAVYAPFGLGAEWDVLDTRGYNSNYPEIDFEDDLKVIDIHPTIAYKVNDKLSLGLGVSITWADIIIRKPSLTQNSLVTVPELKGAADANGLSSITTDVFSHVLTETELTGTGVGFGANVGLKYDFSEDWSVGLSGSWYNDIPLDGKISAVTYGAHIPQQAFTGLNTFLTGMVAAQKLTEAQKTELLGVYSGQEIVRNDRDKGDASLPLPMVLGAGIAYKGIDKLLVTADVSWSQWSAWDVIEIELEDKSKSELVQNWEDGLRFGLGLEYSVTDPLKFRLGYYTEPSAIPDETLNITIPDPSRRHAIAVGAAYDLGLFVLDFNYENILIGDREIDEWVYNPEAKGYENMAGTYKMKVNNFMFGLGYKF
ncbi:outer membrane protein transport protein [candidate division KSB1 bacterium]|nr:outer membrane protein transport protein [candidate division KSB1 bacterium]